MNVKRRGSIYSPKDSESGIDNKVTTARNRRHSSCQDSQKSWKEWYLEMHVKEYLERLKPENYVAEKVSNNKSAHFVAKIKKQIGSIMFSKG